MSLSLVGDASASVPSALAPFVSAYYHAEGGYWSRSGSAPNKAVNEIWENNLLLYWFWLCPNEDRCKSQ